MSTVKRLFRPALLILVLAAGPASWVSAQEMRESPFKGGVVVVSMDDDYGATLVDPEVRTIGGVSFIVGTQADIGQPAEWRAGSVVWLQLGKVSQIVEYASVDEYKSKVSPHGDHGHDHGHAEAPASPKPEGGRL